MNTIVHRANSRGHADHGWLDTHHSFSFASYFNPDRMGFGKLRVLNDDVIAKGAGFGRHPHQNMEIISIPLYGALAHQDSMGNSGTITTGEVQVMSAGTGIEHSEFNGNREGKSNFLQIWVIPEKENVKPRYQQKAVLEGLKPNELRTILTPEQTDKNLWIHQQAWFYWSEMKEGHSHTINLHSADHGVYIFLIDGTLEVAGEKLEKRDAIGITDASELEVRAISTATVLIIEVPMD